MQDQNFKNHARFVPMYHFVALPLALVTLILAVIHCYQTWGTDGFIFSGIFPLLLTILLIFALFYGRVFAKTVQDRVILGEEQSRHIGLTGKPLDPKLTKAQIIALRFAHDNNEYIQLAERAVKENLSPTDIKKAVSTWKADHHRA